MRNGQRLVIQGACLGCLLLAAFGWIVTADAADLQLSPATNPAGSSLQETHLPAVQGQENVQAAGEESAGNLEELFDASIAYTPGDFTSPPDSQADGTQDSDSDGCQVSSAFPESILEWCGLISHYAEKNSLEPDLVAAVILQESGGQHLAYSHSGAVGLMQVMPRDGIAETFMCKNGPCFSSRPTISELQDPEFNIAFGTRMLSGLKERFGNIRDALKSYGPMGMGYAYADKVLAIHERYGN